MVFIKMLSKKTDNERFSKVFMKLSPTPEKIQEPRPPSGHNSFLQDLSMRSQKSTKYGSQIEARSTQQMDQSRAIKLLLEQPEVLINRVSTRLRTDFIPTSNGIRFVMKAGDILVNLSWLHSVKELQSGKILLLYYDLNKIGQGTAKMQSLVLECGMTQGTALLSALSVMHAKYHDDQVQKLYHYLC